MAVLSDPRPSHLRRAVPSRGRPHRARPGAARALPLRRLRGPARCGRTPTSSSPPSRPCGPRSADAPRAVRLVGRGRLGGGGRSRAQGHRRPADLCVRRHRAHARRRGRAGRRDLPPPVPDGPRPREGRRPVLRRARGRDRPRGQAQGHRRDLHPGLRRGRRPSVEGRQASSSRARSTPTSSSRAQKTPPPSSRTTTSAGFPRTWRSRSSSRCGCCSKTRCAPSAKSSACPRRSSGASPSPDRAWRCASSARSTPERAEILRAADAIVIEEIRRAGLYRELWQSFAVLPAVRTVGVMGDERTYAYPIIIRAVTSEDAMTADWARLPYDLLERLSHADHQRGRRRQPGGPRHHVETARHHRVGVSVPGDSAVRPLGLGSFDGVDEFEGSRRRTCPARPPRRRVADPRRRVVGRPRGPTTAQARSAA